MRKRKDKGASLLEAAIIIPLFILVLAGIIDIARWFNLHLQASRIAYEGARFGASLSGLKQYTVQKEDEEGFDPGNRSYPVDGQIYTRIDTMRRHKNIGENQFAATAYRKAAINNDVIGDIVRVEIVTSYTPFFSSFIFDKDIKIIAQAPYLYRNT